MKVKVLKRNIAFGLILILVGFFFLSHDFIVERRERTFSKMNLELTELLAQVDENQEEESIPSEEVPEEQPQEMVDYETYAGILKIPKIGFEKGFYVKESPLNNVKFNLKILDASSYPDEENGNVIIIGHSGNYSNSYFANLYQLQVGDTASIHYQDEIYTYKIVNIYQEAKDGTVTIYRDETKNCLTLITCTKDDSTSQTVYIFELVEDE